MRVPGFIKDVLRNNTLNLDVYRSVVTCNETYKKRNARLNKKKAFYILELFLTNNGSQGGNIVLRIIFRGKFILWDVCKPKMHICLAQLNLSMNVYTNSKEGVQNKIYFWKVVSLIKDDPKTCDLGKDGAKGRWGGGGSLP